LALIDRRDPEAAATALRAKGVEARSYTADAMDRNSLAAVAEAIGKDLGRPDILLNAVGGNQPDATTSAEQKFFDLPLAGLERVVALNLFAGAILPSQVFGCAMAGHGGSIINITSMAADRPLTRIAGYAAAKAGVSNFTRWLAVHLAQEYDKALRVNAIAPGFFSTAQNKYLLWTSDGTLTERGKAIIAHTPQGRFGEPADLAGACVWLASDASRFVTGTVVPIDGGFSAFSGV
ncbi:MAG: SDR family oxidoreductase, partial [bacterium]